MLLRVSNFTLRSYGHSTVELGVQLDWQAFLKTLWFRRCKRLAVDPLWIRLQLFSPEQVTNDLFCRPGPT
jgi:hypothetical protein